jgi:hypothetical protein
MFFLNVVDWLELVRKEIFTREKRDMLADQNKLVIHDVSFLRQRTPSFVSSRMIPMAVSCPRISSARVKFLA